MPEHTFQDWLCLRDERRNFDIDPAQDHAFFFGEKKWHEQIESITWRQQMLAIVIVLNQSVTLMLVPLLKANKQVKCHGT